MPARRVIGVAVATYLVLTSCGLGSMVVDGPPEQTPAALTEARCPRSPAALGLDGGADINPGSGAIPTGFQPVAVLRCRQSQILSDTTSDDTRVTIVEEAAPVTAELLTTLARPDQRLAPGSDSACPAIGWVRPFLLLTDTKGQAVRPRLPTDACNLPRPELDRALEGLRFSPVGTFTVERG